MSTFRFALASIGVFLVAFAGMAWVSKSWGTKSFPALAMRSEPAKPVVQTAPAQAAPAPAAEAKKSAPPKPVQAAVQIPTFEESVKQGIRKDWEAARTAQGDGDPKREALRLAALQAANAFAL